MLDTGETKTPRILGVPRVIDYRFSGGLVKEDMLID